MYLLVIRPQSKKAKEHQKMPDRVAKVADDVATTVPHWAHHGESRMTWSRCSPGGRPPPRPAQWPSRVATSSTKPRSRTTRPLAQARIISWNDRGGGRPSSMDVPLFSPVSTWCPQWCLRRSVPAFFKDHFTQTHPAWSGLAGRPAPRLRGEHRQGRVEQGGPVCRMTSRTPSRRSRRMSPWAAKGATDHHCVFQKPAGLAGVDAELLSLYAANWTRSTVTPARPRCGCATTLTACRVGELALRQAIEPSAAAWT